MTRTRATGVGFVAVILWALLALFTVGSAPVPPLQVTAMSFVLAGAIGVLGTQVTGGWGKLRKVGWHVYVFGTLGLFGYHALYFSALRLAPPAEAGLIAYLWPLLIVLMSGLLPGEQLRIGHFLGALTGFAGAALIVGGDLGFATSALLGYLLAFGCALTWSGYSVLSRELGDAPTETVTIFCLMTAVLSAGLHLALEDTTWPVNTLGWMSILGLGLGPVGLAFYVWDIGVKRGDIQLLGVASYAGPLLSTLILVMAGVAEPSWKLAISAILITGGAALAAHASFKG